MAEVMLMYTAHVGTRQWEDRVFIVSVPEIIVLLHDPQISITDAESKEYRVPTGLYDYSRDVDGLRLYRKPEIVHDWSHTWPI